MDHFSSPPDSSVFVGDVFDAIKYKLYLPGARPPPKKPSPPPASLAGAWNKQLRPGTDFRHGGEPPERGFTNSDNYQSGARKRSYNERLDLDQGEGAGWDGSGGIGRVIKQPRRGGGFGQRGGGAVGGGRGVGGAVGDLNASRIPPLGHQTGVGPALFAGGAGGGGPPHPPPPLNLPPSAVDGGSSLDAKKALEAMITLHSMGMQMPHLMQFMGKPPPMPVQQGAAGRSPAQGKKKGRCRDFDNKGFCARGNTCPWDHGTDAIYAPPPPPPPQLPSRAEGKPNCSCFES